MRNIMVLLFFLAFTSSLSANIIFGTHPLKGGVEFWKQFDPFSTYLSKVLKKPITIRVAKDYKEQGDMVGKDQIDIAFMGPTLFVKVQNEYGPKHLLAKLEVKGKPNLYGVIFTTQNSKIQTLQDLEYKLLAFGSPLSTMSHLIPRYILMEADLEGRYSYRFLGNHVNVALGVLIGDFDAGAVKEEIFEQFKSRGLKMIAKSQPFPEHVFVATNRCPPELVNKIKKALFAIPTQPNAKKIMQSINPEMTGVLPATTEEYDNLRFIMHQLKARQIIQ